MSLAGQFQKLTSFMCPWKISTLFVKSSTFKRQPLAIFENIKSIYRVLDLLLTETELNFAPLIFSSHYISPIHELYFATENLGSVERNLLPFFKNKTIFCIVGGLLFFSKNLTICFSYTQSRFLPKSE